jgi:pilus assembly protein Flp/PilA
MIERIKGLIKDEEGATMVEYALMLALIAVVCIATVAIIGTRANTKFQNTADHLQ